MDRQPELHRMLKALFDTHPHVYFQPPSSEKLVYPCIVYKLSDVVGKYAANAKYIEDRQYELTVIDRDPQSELRERVLSMMEPVGCIRWDPFNFLKDKDLGPIYRRAKENNARLFIGKFLRFYAADNLNHYVFHIYY